MYFPVNRTSRINEREYTVKYSPRVCTVKYFPLRERNTENHLFQHHPTFEGNTEINHNDSLKLYTVAYDSVWDIRSNIFLCLPKFRQPFAFALWISLSQRDWLYIPCRVLIPIQCCLWDSSSYTESSNYSAMIKLIHIFVKCLASLRISKSIWAPVVYNL